MQRTFLEAYERTNVSCGQRAQNVEDQFQVSITSRAEHREVWMVNVPSSPLYQGHSPGHEGVQPSDHGWGHLGGCTKESWNPRCPWMLGIWKVAHSSLLKADPTPCIKMIQFPALWENALPLRVYSQFLSWLLTKLGTHHNITWPRICWAC